jgi:hypothetical protein
VGDDREDGGGADGSMGGGDAEAAARGGADSMGRAHTQRVHSKTERGEGGRERESTRTHAEYERAWLPRPGCTASTIQNTPTAHGDDVM